jgi:heme/copper-type cytochrome/quinol oxidase subunit 2
MPTQARIGLLTTLLTLVGGVWLFQAPFIVGYQDVGQEWIRATRNDLWTGGGLIAISVLTLLLFSAFALRDASRAVENRREADETE